MGLKEEIKKILEEHTFDLCFDKCGNYPQKNEYEIDEYEIDNVVELVMEAINDNPLMEPLK